MFKISIKYHLYYFRNYVTRTFNLVHVHRNKTVSFDTPKEIVDRTFYFFSICFPSARRVPVRLSNDNDKEPRKFSKDIVYQNLRIKIVIDGLRRSGYYKTRD